MTYQIVLCSSPNFLTSHLLNKPSNQNESYPDQSLYTAETVLKELVFTVYLGNFPSDVELATVKLNAETFSVAEAFQSGYTVSEVPHPNGTHAYALKVPFEDPIVLRMVSTSFNERTNFIKNKGLNLSLLYELLVCKIMVKGLIFNSTWERDCSSTLWT